MASDGLHKKKIDNKLCIFMGKKWHMLGYLHFGGGQIGSNILSRNEKLTRKYLSTIGSGYL